MPDVEKTVFISYRRSHYPFVALSTFMDLRAHDYDVFIDVEGIDSRPFDPVVLNQISARAHFLIVLTPGALDHCADPDDWMCREIEYAIKLQRNIVPILVGMFAFAGIENLLTGRLVELTRFNGLQWLYPDFDLVLERLRTGFLNQPFYGVIRPTPTAERAVVRSKLEKATRRYVGLIAERYFSHGNLLHDLGNDQGAIENYSEAIRLNPKHAQTYLSRALVYEKQGEYQKALADYDAALHIIPHDMLVKKWRTEVLKIMKK
ncbi:MAG: tetratricopeptide repeat protein [Chloroflexi bacterium]|nr:tetratricopeptide repeat protein [Chloroflexota bacterium]